MNRKFILTNLKEKEKMVLALMMCGQSIKHSAKCLAISSKTIEWYRERLKVKFSVYSSYELMMEVIKSDEYEELISCGKEILINFLQQSKIKPEVNPKIFMKGTCNIVQSSRVISADRSQRTNIKYTNP